MTWSDSITTHPATTEIFDTANVIITNHENVGRDYTPYTRQFTPCGQEAEYIHLTDKFIIDSQETMDLYGDPGRS